MFAKLLPTLAAVALATSAIAQQMPVPEGSGKTNSPLVASPPSTVRTPILPAKAEPSKTDQAKAGQAAPSVSASAKTAHVPAAPAIAQAIQTPPTGVLSIQQVADAQRQQLTAEAFQKLGLMSTAPSAAAPPAEFPKLYRAPKIYPKIEYVAGAAGDEKAGFRMPDGELLQLAAGDTIKQWQIKNIANGKVYLEMPTNASSLKGAQKKKVKAPASRLMAVGQSLK
jgi:hypothetical protein